MDIKRSTLYYRAKDNLYKKIKEADIKDKIATISYKHPYYGYRRMTAQLKREKVMINHKRVLRMMRELGIQGRIKHQYVTTTNSLKAIINSIGNARENSIVIFIK